MISRIALLKKFLLNNIVTIIMIVLTFILYEKINLGYENFDKLCFCLILPFLCLLQSLVLIIISLYENEIREINNGKTFYLINKYLCLYFNFGQAVILLSSIILNISLLTLFMEMLGLFLLTIGNYFPKLKESKIVRSVSFKVNNDINKWNRFTRVSGLTYMLLGLVIMLLGLFNDLIIIVIALGLIIVCGIGLQLYSIALGKR